jgi:hypothetical protein
MDGMTTDAPVGGESAIVAPTPVTPAESRPMNASEAGRALSEWRKQKNSAPAPSAAPAAAVEQSLPSHEDNAAPPLEVPGEVETQAPDPEASELPPIEPPRSWTKEEKEEFASYPREAQEKIARREQDREAALRRSQNEAADQRKAIEAEAQAAQWLSMPQRSSRIPRSVIVRTCPTSSTTSTRPKPRLSRASRRSKTAATLHEWQTQALAAAFHQLGAGRRRRRDRYRDPDRPSRQLSTRFRTRWRASRAPSARSITPAATTSLTIRSCSRARN